MQEDYKFMYFLGDSVLKKSVTRMLMACLLFEGVECRTTETRRHKEMQEDYKFMYFLSDSGTLC